MIRRRRGQGPAGNHRISTERSFGISVGVVSMAFATLALWHGRATAATVLAAVGGVLVVAGFLAPTVLRLPNRLWWRMAQTSGRINARILLTLFFFVVLTPVGAVYRLLRWNPLQPAGDDTNWKDYPERYRDTNHYERLF